MVGTYDSAYGVLICVNVAMLRRRRVDYNRLPNGMNLLSISLGITDQLNEFRLLSRKSHHFNVEDNNRISRNARLAGRSWPPLGSKR